MIKIFEMRDMTKMTVITEMTEMNISAHADGGPCSRVHVRGILRSAPRRHGRKFSATHVCRINFKDLPNCLELISKVSKISKKTFKT